MDINSTLTINFQTNQLSILSLPKLEFYGLKIDEYKLDGFIFVCKIKNTSSEYKWYFDGIDAKIMYDDHRSWVYLIVVNGYVFKIGETATFLGIRSNDTQTQPNTGTKSRIGRYIIGDATDQDIRSAAQPYLDAGYSVEFWAKKCEIIKGTTLIRGILHETSGSTQKDQELSYIDDFKSKVGVLPMWNKSRK